MSDVPEACRSDAPGQVSHSYRHPEPREGLEADAKPPKLGRGKASGAFDMPPERSTRSRCCRKPGWQATIAGAAQEAPRRSSGSNVGAK